MKTIAGVLAFSLVIIIGLIILIQEQLRQRRANRK